MVFFICNHCGESLKKQVVDKHVFRCKRDINVSCMDCLKDFLGKSYDSHTTCITEAEKYAAKGFVPKENKGAKKQENWVALVRSITETQNTLSPGIKSVFEVIQRNDNIPKKKKGFLNFFGNSIKYIRRADVEAAWALIEKEVNLTKQEQQSIANNVQQEPADPHPNGVKRKAEENESIAKNPKKNKAEENESNAKKPKKNKATTNGGTGEDAITLLNAEETKGTNGTHEQDEETNGPSHERNVFHWNEVIRDALISKNKQMKLVKLKKKVLKVYRQFTAGYDEKKFEKKFEKKLKKTNHVVVENDTVRLIE
ncbi:cell growth-regulating nucleolar protein [Anopheles ziemanni]|uniref:cell growth-regulating nucleolar protein n=1 Tax=Anopheles coustani TaxID=139045 RepID=UPI002659A18A|nr:cell growth-regulating nucleolar protein [Anopheles coustani]XP_058169306.1 cell growth-regulating nucleolar protein [Anopheles ziemanni]